MRISEKMPAARRIIAGCAIAALWAIGTYFLAERANSNGTVAISFAIVQPTAINAFLAWVCDPLARRGRIYYSLVPVFSAVRMVAIAVVVLREGAVCVAMFTPIWVVCGLVGSLLTYKLRKRSGAHPDYSATFRAHGLLALPLMIMPLEAGLPIPSAQYSVIDEIVIAAPAEEIWPLMQGMGNVQASEGRWNFSQDVLGLPRPHAAWLEGSGVGAIRQARWQRGVAFREVLDIWQPNQRIGWRFDFAGSTGWDVTDPHLQPDGPQMQILSGEYVLIPLDEGRNLLRLKTRYVARTHFNAYAALWGERLLGDIQGNMLAAIKARAEG